MSRLATLSLAGLCLAACGAPPTPQAGNTDRPMRIVSLDYCADQYVLKFADPEQILAISPDGVKDFSYMRDQAVGVPTVRPVAEDVLILKPDLVVRAYGGGPNAEAFFERAGVPVLTVGWTSNVDTEEVGSIPSLIQQMADGLGQSERGRALVTDFRARLAAIDRRAGGEEALYLTPAGVTTGPGAMVHEMLVSAGFENFQEQPGWRSIPLERLAYERPDVIAAAFFDQQTNHPDSWSPMNHPVAERHMDEVPVVPLKGAWTACGGWFILDAIEALAEGGAS
ncbi:ABC transporter substrate-binding protein [Henriciella algicola]|uniref:ABC transporter substrate-binding protein n=1 Tax=Henriciella algicola TaxID=1608422 RepID=A0A399RJ86_9PROT|nr:ABC transporter substrate-binding protein [Henriciella algicola]RIJ31328.1 ABC transporter substrate-binding protein [Henriciella algicola]